MLKEKTYNSGDIVTVYLQTGQEILGKFVSEDDNSTVIKKPLTVAIGPKGAAFQTFTVTGDSESNVSFKTGKIISVLKTNKATSESYKTATSTILTPDKGKILLNTSGEPLYKRDYRTIQHEAPINETIAACILKSINWDIKFRSK